MIREKVRKKLEAWTIQHSQNATLMVLDSISYNELIAELNELSGSGVKINHLDFYCDLSSIMMVCRLNIQETDKRICGFAYVAPDMFDL
jgi:hypothetical protein